ncbi:hypothetical protein D9758_003286 [Tetrapyrgos nigripes]|uniref:SRR1-like domain-containing protein n=1 Tax=Tetrapyrgos nigripes TaxID=182062 RepID=A0A8H5GIB1_9AGAR|nr:hypothetical protein D9758_003286 [Tetrapyrgos nigripes]
MTVLVVKMNVFKHTEGVFKSPLSLFGSACSPVHPITPLAMSQESNSYRYAEFSAPVSRKKRKNAKSKVPLLTLLQNSRDDLKKDEWSTRTHFDALDKKSWKSTARVVCLGLGSPSNSPIPRAQLGFLLDMCDVLKIDFEQVTVYDPVFTEQDHCLLKGLEFRTPLSGEDLGVTADDPTIFFMPHCDIELYENVLRKNWTGERLSNLILVSNRLEDYVENNSVDKLESTAPAVLRIVPFLSSQSLPPSKIWPAAFNNTSVQYIPANPDWFSEIPLLPSESE